MAQMLQELETELEARYETVNRRILSGENTQIKLKQKNGETLWTLPYPSGEDTVNDPLFDAFTNILGRYVKTTLDRQTILACLIAYGTNVGLGKMGAISDLSYQTLYAAANHFLRPETGHQANDQVSNAIAKLPIFRHYDIDEVVHSSSDGQKFET